MHQNNIDNRYLQNERLRLRALEPADLDLLFQWENSEETWHVSNTTGPLSRHLLEKYLDSAHHDVFATRQLRLIVESRKPDKAIGTIELFDFDALNLRAGTGIIIADKSARGKGFASDAVKMLISYSFEILFLNQLYCNIAADNQDSINLFTRLGFEKTGNKKQWLNRGTGFMDEYFFQLIREK